MTAESSSPFLSVAAAVSAANPSTGLRRPRLNELRSSLVSSTNSKYLTRARRIDITTAIIPAARSHILHFSRFTARFLFVLSILIASPLLAQTVMYSVQDVGLLPDYQFSFSAGINNLGQVTGTMVNASFQNRAFMTGPNGDGLIDLGALRPDLAVSDGRGINDSGVVVGYSVPQSSGSNHAFVSAPNGGPLTDLGTLPGASDSFAYAVNATGQITGQSYNASGQSRAVFIAAPGGSMTDLGTLPGGTSSFGLALNNSGQVVGIAAAANGQDHAFITQPNGGAMTDLGLLAGWTFADASAINASGQVVGGGGPDEADEHAFVTGPNGIGLLDLGTLGGRNSRANAINSSGTVIGDSQTAGGQSDVFIWTPATGMRDLSSLIDPSSDFQISEVTGINDLGQIVGAGINSLGHQDVVLLTPIEVPEPATWLVGTLAVVAVVRKRQSRRR